MSNPVVLHLVRPYANAHEYIEREAWSLDLRSMVLIGEAGLEAETDVAFDVTLGDGSKPIRAEARVIGVVGASGERPGGLRVRFKRYGAATRAFLERAESARWSSGDAPTSVTPDPAPVSRASSPPPPRVEALAPPLGSKPPPAPASEPPASSRTWEEDRTSRFRRSEVPTSQKSSAPPSPGSERLTIPVVAPPPNRDDLLERLRQRARETASDG